MKTQSFFLMFGLASAGLAAAQTAPLVYKAPTPSPAPAPAEAAPAATPAPPPAGPAKRSMADLEKLVAPIALYPDQLIATILPASVYPLEIVQAARFVMNTNNLSKLDAQPWDDSVKAVARIPDAIKKLDEDIGWTMELGEAFLAQDKEILDAVQSMRTKAQKAGTLKTSEQQIVTVTNMVIEKTVEEKVVMVTNTVVQIQPASSSVVYVPSYNPYTVYYPPPAYYANPYPLMTFTAGFAMGAIIANNCNWYGGGCWHGGDVDIDIDSNRTVNRNTTREGGRNNTSSTSAGQKKWQPDQSRMSKSGSPSTSAAARGTASRGWGGSSGARPSTGAAARPSTGAAGARPSTGAAGARPSTGAAGARPSAGTASARPSPSAGASRPSAPASRPSASPSASPSRSSSSGSAFGGMSSGSSARSSSSRGTSSRSGGFGGGGRGGGGGRR